MDSKYINFGPVDLVTDDLFLRHRLAPTAESNALWDDFLERNPEKVLAFQEATALLDAVVSGLTSYSRNFLSEEDEARLLERILLANRNFENSRVVPLRRMSPMRWIAAACIILAMASAAYVVLKKPAPETLSYEQRIDLLSESVALTRYKNQTNKLEIYYLPDSSSVELAPGSGLSFTSEYGKQRREIYLTGKAVLDVVPQAQKPFFVFANDIVTKVLGTRFEVVAYDGDSDVTVKVLSGKVSVYRNKEGEEQEVSTPSSAAVLLLPNQQVIFNRNMVHFDKKLVDKPVPVVVGKSFPAFEYEDGPAVAFFEDIEKAYGVHVVYNADLMKNCQLSAVLTDESMMEKIDVVCKTIGATYEVIDAQIVVTASGCAN